MSEDLKAFRMRQTRHFRLSKKRKSGPIESIESSVTSEKISVESELSQIGPGCEMTRRKPSVVNGFTKPGKPGHGLRTGSLPPILMVLPFAGSLPIITSILYVFWRLKYLLTIGGNVPMWFAFLIELMASCECAFACQLVCRLVLVESEKSLRYPC